MADFRETRMDYSDVIPYLNGEYSERRAPGAPEIRDTRAYAAKAPDSEYSML